MGDGKEPNKTLSDGRIKAFWTSEPHILRVYD